MPTPDKPVALITGGSRGIGYGIAQQLAAADYCLAINGRRPEEEVRDALKALSTSDVLYCRADVGNLDDHQPLLDSIRERFGRLDVLINNAGVAPDVRADVLQATPESFDRLIRINLRGPYFLTQAAARWMIDQRASNPDLRPAIINVTSVSAVFASTNRGDYCISKAGLGMATQLWASRLGEHGIPVYEVRPGVVHTDMTTAVAEKYDRMLENGLTIEPRWGEPEDVGRAVAVLATGALPYTTGNVLYVDGGLSRRRL